MKYEVVVLDKKFVVDVKEIDSKTFEVEVNGKKATIRVEKILPELPVARARVTKAKEVREVGAKEAEKKPELKEKVEKGEGREVVAPMTGVVTKILKKEGEEVKEGENVLIIEAMKMENPIPSPSNGVISKIAVKEGDKVSTGDVLFYVK